MGYSKSQINRIGNTLVYLTSKLGPLPKTKLFKLIYIIEEQSVKKAGVPFTELTYTFMPMGPVATFVMNQLEKNRPEMASYVKCDKKDKEHIISPTVDFDDSEFSEFDFEVINEVINRFGHLSGTALSEHTHKEGSLWKKIKDDYEAQGKNPIGKATFDMMQLLDDPDVDENVRIAAKEEKAFTDFLYL
jgi:uncharacterized phage-associated protein